MLKLLNAIKYKIRKLTKKIYIINIKNKKKFYTLKKFKKIINFKFCNINIKFFKIILYCFKEFLLKKYFLK